MRRLAGAIAVTLLATTLVAWKEVPHPACADVLGYRELLQRNAAELCEEVMPSGDLLHTSATAPVVTTTLPPAPTTTIPQAPTSTTTTIPQATTSTTLPDSQKQSEPIVLEGICAEVPDGWVPDSTMRWCRLIAEGLDRWSGLTLDSLMHNLTIVECESRGRPDAKNPISSARGLYQHIDTFRDNRAQKWLGRGVPDWNDPGDSILVGTALYVYGGASHWPNCGRR